MRSPGIEGARESAIRRALTVRLHWLDTQSLTPSGARQSLATVGQMLQKSVADTAKHWLFVVQPGTQVSVTCINVPLLQEKEQLPR